MPDDGEGRRPASDRDDADGRRLDRARHARTSASPPARAFAYALLRVVPRLERGEQLNVGVVVFCRQHDFLELRAELDDVRLAAIAPDLDPEPIRSRLRALGDVVAGDPAAGALARLQQSERFGWIVAPTSTVIQPSAVHTGLTDDPRSSLDRLFAQLVA